MSEPPRKKKKTILDFFKKGSNKSDPKGKKVQNSTSMNNSVRGAEMCAGTSDDWNVPLNVKPLSDSVGSEDNNIKDIPSGSDFDSDSRVQKDNMEMSEPSSDSQIDVEIPTRKPSQRGDNCEGKGTPMKMLNKSPDCLPVFPHLRTTESHTVLFNTEHYSYDPKKIPKPFPSTYKDRWDNDHVRMPCSHMNEYPIKGKDGKQTVRRRWDLIQEVLSENIPGPFELEEAILQYNSRYADRWDFKVMHQFFCDELHFKERKEFFNTVLKDMVKLALMLPDLCTQPIPLLKKGKTHCVTFTQQQIASLLANAFFCTFPRRNAKQKTSEYSNYSSINFNSLFDGHTTSVKLEKLKCLVNYFRRVTTSMPTGNVTFIRQCIEKNRLPHWAESSTTLRGLHVSAEGTIEDDGEGLLQVDFANKFLGGGVLGHGCVQEEIRFLICPEMFISRLITECLDENECLIMKDLRNTLPTGCERFNDYDGYARTFKWKGNYEDKTKRDPWGRLCTDVVAIDALIIHQYGRQFRNDLVTRELNKAYCGFVNPVINHVDKKPHNLQAVCTGNWGCGAFGGDKRLKALIQLMAAAEARRDVCYFTFDDKALRDDVYHIHTYLTVTNPLDIGNIMTLIKRYENEVIKKYFRKPKYNLYQYITKVFDGTLEDTDTEENHTLEGMDVDFSQSSQEAQLVSDRTLVRGDSVDYKAETP